MKQGICGAPVRAACGSWPLTPIQLLDRPSTVLKLVFRTQTRRKSAESWIKTAFWGRTNSTSPSGAVSSSSPFWCTCW
eukprot:scaffold145_cov261-Pinguiococcus_pyrenoidosus.AAC.13